VKERIFIRELDDVANRNNLQMWDERAILLDQGVMPVRRERKSGCTCQRVQPNRGWHSTMLSWQ
jgi:hypothetical protein